MWKLQQFCYIYSSYIRICFNPQDQIAFPWSTFSFELDPTHIKEESINMVRTLCRKRVEQDTQRLQGLENSNTKLLTSPCLFPSVFSDQLVLQSQCFLLCLLAADQHSFNDFTIKAFFGNKVFLTIFCSLKCNECSC